MYLPPLVGSEERWTGRMLTGSCNAERPG
jgi:hypothetical protein